MIKNSILVVLCIFSFIACSGNPAQESTDTNQNATQVSPTGTTGTVVETMDAGNYTYVKVDTGSEEIWAAAPTFSVSVDDEVKVPEGMAMQDFHSDSLDRDFPLIYFVAAITKAGEAAPAHGMMPAGHPVAAKGADVDTSDLEKVEGTTSIGDLYAKPAAFVGKELTFHAKVVKVNLGIMGKNWMHISDGSGDEASGSNDLTVTTDGVAAVGDTVTVVGAITLDKDFGAGYRYDIIVEDAQVTVK